MCGIFAVFSTAGPIREDFGHCLDLLAHRGPDGAGQKLISLEGGAADCCADRAWLGHRRLAIMDPTPRGLQPMMSGDNRYAIVFNGEIYNFIELREQCRAAGATFHTGTDTEVLIAAWSIWGEAALTRLTGMFAFVIVDRHAGVAWLARDAFGIKPLHYALAGDRLLISSEIAPIVASGFVPVDIDATQSFEFIRFGAATSAEQTAICGIKRLPPATVARFDFREGRLLPPERYWAPTSDRREIGFDDAVAECRERFLANLRLHLRSDVPVGAALSGGIDSSAIVCGLKAIEPDLELNTFSFISADPRMSEEKWVDIVNDHIRARPHKVRPEPGDLGADLEALVRAQGEPFGTSSIYAQYRVFKMAREAGVPVTLDGQGADEMLGGYWPFLGTVGAQWLRSGKFGAVASLVRHGGPTNAVRAGIVAQIAQASLPSAAQRGFRALIGRGVMPDFLDRDWFDQAGSTWREAAAATIGSYANLREHLADSLTGTSLPTLLRIADRSSMASSVESRVPFLTPDFADFVLALPAEYLVSRRGDRKHVFREAMGGILPEPIRTRRDKIGFVADDGLWLRANWSAFAAYEDEIHDAPQFDTKRTLAYHEKFRSGGGGSAHQVLRNFIFTVWRRQMMALAQPRPVAIDGETRSKLTTVVS